MFRLLAVGAWATALNVATFDGPVDLAAPALAPFVRAADLRALDHLGVDLERANSAASDGHGTAVATRLLHDLPPEHVTLVPVPLSPVARGFDLLRGLAGLIGLECLPNGARQAACARASDRLYESLDRLITVANVRLVNLSLGFDLDDAFYDGFWGRLRSVRAFQRAHAERMIALMAKHPETLFVSAAGNDGRDLTTTSAPSLATAGLPNLIVVGAHLGARLGPAAWSNRSKHLVDAFAFGREDGGAEGTSYGAPVLANVALTAWLEDPSRTADEVKAHVLDVACAPHPRYTEFARGARVLPAAGFGEPVVPTFALKYDPNGGEDRFDRALDAAAGDEYARLRAQNAPWGLLMADPTYRARFLMLKDTLIAATPAPFGQSERVRLHHWLRGRDGPKRVIAYAADGSRILGGVMIAGARVAALDAPSRALIPVVRTAACAAALGGQLP